MHLTPVKNDAAQQGQDNKLEFPMKKIIICNNFCHDCIITANNWMSRVYENAAITKFFESMKSH